MFNRDKRIESLQNELFVTQRQLNELRTNFNELVSKDRIRIALLIEDIKQKFEDYFDNLKNAGAFIETNSKPIECKEYSEESLVEPKRIEYGEIEIKPLHLKFIKGELFELKGKVEDE